MEIEDFYIIGISVRTTNQNGQSGKDIMNLWNRFFAENVLDKVPKKLDSRAFYSVYTDYEGDYTKPYTAILGCKVAHLNAIPEGMVGKTIPGGQFKKFTAKGNLGEGIVFSEWSKIWNLQLDRKYSADFEVYGEKAQNPENAEVDIFIALNSNEHCSV